MLRPVCWLPPKRLLTPRSDGVLSHDARGLLLGRPVPTEAGLAPAGQQQRETTCGPLFRHDSRRVGLYARCDAIRRPHAQRRRRTIEVVTSGSRLPLDAEAREQMKEWLENWQRVGAILEAERWERLAALTPAEAQQATRDLLELWRPDWTGDDGEELLLHQQVFARSRSGTST